MGLERLKVNYRKSSLYDWYLKYLYWPYNQYIKGLSSRIKTLIAYFPILWNDEDFDYHYLLKILEKKLERMIPAFEQGYSVGNEKRVKELKIALFITKRLRSNYYSSKEVEEIEKRLGNFNIEVLPEKDDYSELKVWNGEEKPCILKETRDGKIRKIIYNKWTNNKKADTKYLFDLIGKKLLDWWD